MTTTISVTMTPKAKAFDTTSAEPIAITGIGLRFPNAINPQAFWSMISEGRGGIRGVPLGRWPEKEYYNPTPGHRGKIVTNQGGFLERIDHFDWRAFRISPREASRIDPQHRLLLETTWEAFEDAGLPFETLAGSKTGVFIGITWNDFLRAQSSTPDQLDGYTATGNLFTFASNRISHFFDLVGPSISLDGACASSLMAIQLACDSLRSRQTNLAIVGGVELMVSPDSSVIMSQAGILSPTGQCSTLDEKANGFVRGEGAGVLVLQRLSDVTIPQSIYALICGAAVNHNGKNNWIMAPNGQAQESVIQEAYKQAGKKPSQVDYVELHGTAFPEGDVVETAALGKVIGQAPRRKRPCLIGANKPNLGNMGAAGGLASLIKVALSLHHTEIPPTINLKTVNPQIPLEELNLTPARERIPWPKTKGRAPLAGVHGTSLSGSNAHVVLEQYAAPSRRKRPLAKQTLNSSKSQGPQLTPYPILLSARSEGALKKMARALVAFIGGLPSHNDITLADFCYTLAVHRTHHDVRLAFCGDTFAEVKVLLELFIADESSPKLHVGTKSTDKRRKVLYKSDKMARLFSLGYSLSWEQFFGETGHFVRLPTYQWDKDRCWPDWLNSASGEASFEDKGARYKAAEEQKAGNIEDEARDKADRTQIQENQQVEEITDAKIDVEKPGVDHLLETSSSWLEELQHLPINKRKGKLRMALSCQITQLLDLPSGEILVWDKSFQELGIDSFLAVELTHFVNQLLDIRMPATLLFKYADIDRLADYLAEETTLLPTIPEDNQPERATANRLEKRLDGRTDDEMDALRTLFDKKVAELEVKFNHP
ncbi:MAG: beta-ketoacyl synthase N-terminal-like domain-containing protein [Chloroflexota bacterium]